MRVFVTGATGFIGSAVVRELIDNGHAVLGLARSDSGAAQLEAAGAAVHRGSLEDPSSLAAGAASADGVIHLAFIHDFKDLAAAGRADSLAIQTIGDVLAGSDRPFVVTSGTALMGAGHLSTEDEAPDLNGPGSHRAANDVAARALAGRGVRATTVRLPPSVHGDGDLHGFIPRIIALARERRESAYAGDGANRWAAVHRLDAARLFRLALERGEAGAAYHGVGDEGVPTRDIASAIGKKLNVPIVSKPREEITSALGFVGAFFSIDVPASSALTQARLGWTPTHPTLLEDLEGETYVR